MHQKFITSCSLFMRVLQSWMYCISFSLLKQQNSNVFKMLYCAVGNNYYFTIKLLSMQILNNVTTHFRHTFVILKQITLIKKKIISLRKFTDCLIIYRYRQSDNFKIYLVFSVTTFNFRCSPCDYNIKGIFFLLLL